MLGMRTRALCLTAMTLTLFGSLAGTAPASAYRETHCTFAYYISLSPGLSTQPSSGSLTVTDGRGSTGIDCHGPVNGQHPTGNGTMSIDGNYGTEQADSCASGILGGGEAKGVNIITVPTSSGTQKVINNVTFTYGQPSSRGVVSGTFEGDHYSGTFGLWPTEGNCITRPITKAYITGEGVLR